MRPSLRSALSTRATVGRVTRNCSMSASYVGSFAPGAYCPDRISLRNTWTICSAFRDGIDALQRAHHTITIAGARRGKVWSSSLHRPGDGLVGGRTSPADVMGERERGHEPVIRVEARLGGAVRPDRFGR